MQLVNAVTIVYDFEASHHKTGNTGFFAISNFISQRVMIAFRLTQLYVVISLSFEPSFHGLYIVVTGHIIPSVIGCDILRIYFRGNLRGCLLLQQIIEIRNQFLKRNWPYPFTLKSRNSYFPYNCNLVKYFPQNFVHSNCEFKYV